MSNLDWTMVDTRDSASWVVSSAAGSVGQITGKNAPTVNEEDLFSYRAGLVYKPTDRGTVYLSYSNSQTPSKASVNGACTALTCNVDPESANNVELGTKWELFDRHLALTAAVFRNTRENYKVADFEPHIKGSGGIISTIAAKVGCEWNTAEKWIKNNAKTMVFNYAFLAGDIVHLDTNRGQRSATVVRGGTTTPLLAYMTTTSPWLELHSQTNTMNVYGAAPANLIAGVKTLKYRASYWGV